jgi:hypothetical protein
MVQVLLLHVFNSSFSRVNLGFGCTGEVFPWCKVFLFVNKNFLLSVDVCWLDILYLQ